MIRPEAQAFAAQFAALGHANRVEILRHLLTAHPDGLVVGEIQEQLGIPGSTLSHHLEALRQEQLVLQVREGRFLRYRAGTDALRALLGFLYAECCAGDAAGFVPKTLIQLGRPSPSPVATPGATSTIAPSSPPEAHASSAGERSSTQNPAPTPAPAAPHGGSSWKTW